MSNVLKQEKQHEICALGRLGWSLRRIQDATGVHRETVALYLKAAGIGIRRPRGRKIGAPPGDRPEHAAESKPASQVTIDSGPDSKPASQVTTDPNGESAAAHRVAMDLERGSGRSPAASACEPYRELILSALEKRRNAVSIWQDLVTEHGFDAGYQSVKRYVRKLRGHAGRDAHPTIHTDPGEEGQVDYGTGPMVLDEHTGKYRRTRLFVLTLGYSRKSIWLLAFKSSSKKWCQLHEEAFRRLGGVPRVIVLDNLKEGVVKADIYDPQLNPLYSDMLAHYGVVGLPARVRHPDRKGKVERAVGHAQSTPLKGRRFDSLEAAQDHLDKWSKQWADTRIHGTTKRQVAAMFAEEKPSLATLPVEPFRYYKHGNRVVHLDGCVEIDAAYYGAPPGWIGRQLCAQWDAFNVRLLHPTTGELLREHRKRVRGHRVVHPDDVSKKTPPSTLELLCRARRKGESIGDLCERIHLKKGEGGVRSILGVLSLTKKHGPELIEPACRAAIEVGLPTYRFVRRWIDHQPPEQCTLLQIDPLIRELNTYRDIINQKTQTETR